MGGTPKSSILIGCSSLNHPAIGVTAGSRQRLQSKKIGSKIVDATKG